MFLIATTGGNGTTTAVHTAKFVSNMDTLFDSINSNKQHGRNGKPMSCSATKESGHIKYWKEMIDWIKKWEFLKPNGKNAYVACKKGWVQTLTGIIYICEMMFEKGQSYIMTRRLNQDKLENLFSLIRSKGGNNYYPTVTQFRAAFKTVAVQKLLNSSAKSNCEPDPDDIIEILTSISDNITASQSASKNQKYIIPQVTSNKHNTSFNLVHFC